MTEPGPIYAVQFLSALENPSWNSLTNVPGTGAPALVYDALSTNSLRLYRLQLQ
jgi:hypothetical protein